jgi:hypothetical protein
MKRRLQAGLAVLAFAAGSAIAQQPYERTDTPAAYPESRTDRDWREPRERTGTAAPRTYDSHDPKENSALWGVG